jgi:hypothetical protein
MATARRLYLYVVSAIGLSLVLVSAVILLQLVISHLAGTDSASSPFGFSSPSPDSLRETLAQAIGLMAVGLPLWLFHWGLTERMVHGDEPAAQAERQSVLRAFYFATMLAILAAIAVVTVVQIATQVLTQSLGASSTTTDLAPVSAVAFVITAAWAYHAWIRARDVRLGSTIRGAAAWISRLYLYGAAFYGLFLALSATSAFASLFVEAAAGHDPHAYYYGYFQSSSTGAWWVSPLVTACVPFLLGAWIWAGHMLYASRLRARDTEQGELESSSRVRLAFFVGVVVLTAAQVAVAVGESLGMLLAQASSSTGGGSNWRAIVTLPASVVFYAVAWWAHRHFAAREQRAVADSAGPAVRPMDYGTSLVGLALVVIGLVGILSVVARKIAGVHGVYGFEDGSFDTYQISFALGILLAGLPIWLWPRLTARRRQATDRPTEVRSSSRRYYFFFILGVAVVAGSFLLITIVSQIFRAWLGLDSSAFGSIVRDPIVDLIVVAAVLLLHVPTLRSDLGFPGIAPEILAAAELPVAGPAEAETATLEPRAPAPATAPRSPEVVITGPQGADLEPLRAWLLTYLPAGYLPIVRTSGEEPES